MLFYFNLNELTSMNINLLRRKAPGIAILCFLAIPFLGLIFAAINLAGVKLRAAAGWPMVVLCLAALGAALLLLVRLRLAPAIALALTLVVWIIASFLAHLTIPAGIDPYERSLYAQQATQGLGGPISIMVIGGLFALWRWDAFTWQWVTGELPEQLRQGLKRLLRDSPAAAQRALAGIGSCLLSFIFIGLAIGNITVLGKGAVGLLIGGGSLLASSVQIHDE